MTPEDLPVGTRFVGVHKYQPRGKEVWVRREYDLNREGTCTCTGLDSVEIIKILGSE